MLDQVLSGLRVLDLTQNVAGPSCTQVLGDLGADVIKVERPGRGDDTRNWRPPEIGGQSAIFLALNRNKRSIGLDLDDPAGVEILRRLAGEADILVHSLKPGSAEARGFGHADLGRQSPPDLSRDQRLRQRRAVVRPAGLRSPHAGLYGNHERHGPGGRGPRARRRVPRRHGNRVVGGARHRGGGARQDPLRPRRWSRRACSKRASPG